MRDLRRWHEPRDLAQPQAAKRSLVRPHRVTLEQVLVEHQEHDLATGDGPSPLDHSAQAAKTHAVIAQRGAVDERADKHDHIGDLERTHHEVAKHELDRRLDEAPALDEPRVALEAGVADREPAIAGQPRKVAAELTEAGPEVENPILLAKPPCDRIVAGVGGRFALPSHRPVPSGRGRQLPIVVIPHESHPSPRPASVSARLIAPVKVRGPTMHRAPRGAAFVHHFMSLRLFFDLGNQKRPRFVYNPFTVPAHVPGGLRMKLVRFAFAASLAVVPLTQVLSVTTASACGNSYRYELDPKTNMLVRAEESLQEGDFKKAYKLAADATGPIGKSVEGKDKPATLDSARARALRVAAIATIKSKGSATKDKAEVALGWAVDQLRVLAAREQNNPYLMARLAEGLALQPDGQKEALAILAKLAEDDMMPDSAAWLLYGQLSNDEKVKTRALEQCKLRANDPATCKLKGPGES